MNTMGGTFHRCSKKLVRAVKKVTVCHMREETPKQCVDEKK
tara:strand:- start:353 stop:475 length:123 start_codon:yes stop_codon:yes gene_type:complete